jgi:hypothetical protein
LTSSETPGCFTTFDLLFSLNVRHVLFANAGSLFIIMLIPWRNRRDVVFQIADPGRSSSASFFAESSMRSASGTNCCHWDG